jgi:potassium intermediate/small conductance calcium-activated channel subfamily N protein 2
MLSILIFGIGLRAAEIPYMQVSNFDWTYLWNSMWCTVITMTTVGYGDFYPRTHLGRCIAILACLLGNVMISLMVVSLTTSSEFSPSQRKAYDNIMKEIGVYEHNKKAILVV